MLKLVNISKQYKTDSYVVDALKDVNIANNSIIGFGSVVTKPFNQDNVIIAGVPAQIVKNDIYWHI